MLRHLVDVAQQGKVAEFLAEPYLSEVASCLTRTKVRTSFVDVFGLTFWTKRNQLMMKDEAND